MTNNGPAVLITAIRVGDRIEDVNPPVLWPAGHELQGVWVKRGTSQTWWPAGAVDDVIYTTLDGRGRPDAILEATIIE